MMLIHKMERKPGEACAPSDPKEPRNVFLKQALTNVGLVEGDKVSKDLIYRVRANQKFFYITFVWEKDKS